MAFDDDLDDKTYLETRFFQETIQKYYDNLTLDSVIEIRNVKIESTFLKDITKYIW